MIRFRRGASPDKIVQSFPTLKLSQLYGAIAYYLDNEKALNDYIAEGERELERSAVPLSQSNTEVCAPGSGASSGDFQNDRSGS